MFKATSCVLLLSGICVCILTNCASLFKIKADQGTPVIRANSSSLADTLLINSTPFLQSALCKDGVLFYYSYSTAATLKSETDTSPKCFLFPYKCPLAHLVIFL